MKKFVRFAGVAVLALTIGVFGCDDDDPVAPVAPTVTVTVPTTPPTPPPLVVTMDPPSADVAVGSNVVFAVNASGGAAGATASWTCASSDTTIATDSVTTSGCQATGVAPGGVTITAAVTKGSETGNVGSQLTVMGPQVGDQAFILLASIKWGEGNENTETTGLKGRVDVQANVERGDQVLEAVTLLVDGDAVASTSFGVVAEPAVEEEPAAQAIHAFTLSFDSDDYDLSTGSPAYMNGDHEISMQLKVAGSAPISSNALAVDFDNDDGVYVTVSGLGEGALNSGTGQRWYGGPAAAVEVTAVPVRYSGASTASVGIGAFCGDEDGSTATAAPFVLTPECEGTGERTATFTADGADIDVLNSDVFPLYLDYDGPSAPIFSPNPNNRENGWVNLTVDFLGEQGSRNKDGWLTYNDDDDSGVGGYQPVLRYAEDDDIKDAIAASPLTLANLPGESEINAYCAVASAVDLLGNESSLPGGDCLMAGDDENGYGALLKALSDAAEEEEAVATAEAALADAGLLVGVDVTPPGIEIDEDERINDVDNLTFDFDVYDDENEDSNSGLHTLPLLVSMERRDASDTECLVIDDGTGVTAGAVDSGNDMDCDDTTGLPNPTTITFAGTPAPSHAYYTLSGTARDKAGNSSGMTHTFVFDGMVATATMPAAPGALKGGESFQVASFLNDDLSIRDYYVTADFPAVGNGTAIRLGVVAPTAVDAFDADPLTRRNYSVTTDVSTYAGLQEDAMDTDVTTLTTVTVAVRDQADSDGADDGTASPSLGVEAPEDGFANEFTIAFAASETTICAADKVADCEGAKETETKLSFVATSSTSTLSNPFDRVDFWVQDVNGASWMLGSDTSGESGRMGGTDENTARNRTWTFSLDASAAELYMRTREAAYPRTTPSDMHLVHAFGVNDDDIALVQSVTITIDDGEAMQ